MKNTLSGATLVLFAVNCSFTIMEKLYHLLIWTHPIKTRFVFLSCIVAAKFQMITPNKVIQIAAGYCIMFPVEL